MIPQVTRNIGGSGNVISNQGRSTVNFDPRRTKPATQRAKSPSPDLEEEDTSSGGSTGGGGGVGGGLVIANRHDSLNNYLEDEEGEGEGLDPNEVDGDDLKTEEEETLSLLIDSRLLHKDFILDKFALALVYFRKVSRHCFSFLCWRLEFFFQAGKVGAVAHMESLLKFSKYLVELKVSTF